MNLNLLMAQHILTLFTTHSIYKVNSVPHTFAEYTQQSAEYTQQSAEYTQQSAEYTQQSAEYTQD